MIDWEKIFYPETPILEILIRGSLTYLIIFILLRIILRRESGQLGMADMLVLVLLSDASQNAMAGGYSSVTDGIILIVTIMAWSHFIEWLAYRWRFLHKLISPQKLILIKDGKMIRNNMRKELITKDELMEAIREHGYERIEEIKQAYIESEGNISIIAHDKK
jgi:uncharacterized membrane protein YcaP (DUF421 family)